jgi:hypothetical protein
MKITGKFTSAQLVQLRIEFNKIKKVDPASETYKRIIEILNSMSQTQLKQVRDAQIPFMSRLAINRIKQAA